MPNNRKYKTQNKFSDQGAFSIYKNFWKIYIGNFRLEEGVPFATSSIRGSRGTPGRLKDRERSGTGDKKQYRREICKWNTNFPLGSFHRENGTTFRAVPLFLGIFQSGEPKKRFSFNPEPEFSEFLTTCK